MTLQELHELIDEERYSEIFQALEPYYEKITDKTIYNGLRKEYMKGMKSIDYEDRVRTFVNNLEKILPKDSDTTEDKKIADSEKDNTTNIYIKSNVIKGDNHGKIDNNFS
jgi:membrane-bound lytic murein transglycosylase MltF